jgi:hypothetical protein
MTKRPADVKSALSDAVELGPFVLRHQRALHVPFRKLRLPQVRHYDIAALRAGRFL